MEYVERETVGDGATRIWDLDGVSHLEADTPSYFHFCWAQTRGFVNYFTFVERCPCGAIKLDHERKWRDRNSDRRR